MQRNWLMLSLQTVLTGALAAGPSFAQGNSDGAKPPALDAAALAKQLDDFKRTLTADLSKSLGDDLRKALAADIEKLTLRLETLDRNLASDLKELRGKVTMTDVNVAAAQRDITDLKTQMLQLRQDLDAMKAKMAAPSQISAYRAGSAPPAMPALGRLRLVNSYFEPMTVIVNGRPYTVAPGGDQLTDPLPAGAFTYEVLAVQPPRTRTLAANETFVVTIYPL